MVHLLDAYEAFEERVAAIGEPDGVEPLVVDHRLAGVLLHYGWQLLIVADEDKLVGSGQQAHNVGFQDLAGLVDDGQVEVFEVEEVGSAEHGCRGSHDDLRVENLAFDLHQLAILLQCVVEQVVAKALVARVLVADAQEMDAIVA